MFVVLLMLIVLILLFGAGVVKGWLTNAFGYGISGLILLAIALKLASYMGEYGLLWIIGITALVVGGGVGAGIYYEERDKRKMIGRVNSRSTDQLEAVHSVWGKYVREIRERFSLEAQNRARALYAADDGAELERFCCAEIRKLSQQRNE